MQRVIKNAKSRDTEPGCQAYYFFVPQDGNEEFLYGVEMYSNLKYSSDNSYDDEKAIKETHFSSSAFQSFQA
jgi:quinol monooxygenase YgiN